MNIHQLLLNMASNYVRMFFGIITALFLTPLIVSRLGSEALGLWALSASVAGYFGLTDLGITSSAIKYISHYRATQQWEALNKTISTSMCCFLPLALFSLIGGCALSFTAPKFFHLASSLVPTAQILMVMIGVVAAIGFLTVLPIQCAIASQRQDLLNRWMLVVQIVTSVASLIGVFMGFGIIFLSALQIFTAICNGLIGYVITRKHLPQASFAIGWHAEFGKQIASFAGIALLMSMASKIIYFSDTMVIGHCLTIVAVAGYAIGLKVLELMRSLVGCGAGVLGTFVCEQTAHGRNENLGVLWIEGSKWALVLTIPICALCVLCGSEMIHAWVGQSYPQAGLALGILAVGLTADLAQSASFQILVNGGQNRAMAILFAIEAFLNLVLSLLLIGPFGLIGVAVGTVIPQVLRSTVFCPIMLSKQTGVPINVYLKNSILPGLKSSVVTIFLVVFYKYGGFHTGRISFLILGLLMAPALAIGIWVYGFAKEQRVFVLGKLRKTIRSSQSSSDFSDGGTQSLDVVPATELPELVS